jgi:hypothetical protein
VIVGRRMPYGTPGWGGRVVRLLLTTSPTRRSLLLAGILVEQRHTLADGNPLLAAYISRGMESVPAWQALLHLLHLTSSLCLADAPGFAGWTTKQTRWWRDYGRMNDVAPASSSEASCTRIRTRIRGDTRWTLRSTLPDPSSTSLR